MTPVVGRRAVHVGEAGEKAEKEYKPGNGWRNSGVASSGRH